MARPGEIIDGKYEILKEIGRGGMSVVYLAMDVRLNKQWAVKELKKYGDERTRMYLKGLEIEADVIKKADHPALPRIVDIIYTKRSAFIVMDYIEGATLNRVIKERGDIPQNTIVKWSLELCDAIGYLHRLNPPVIYRDLKPSNIMLKPDGKVKLIDFGAAKVLNGKNSNYYCFGTMGFAAPEQRKEAALSGTHITDERTDIYSLGATMYALFTKEVPCKENNVVEKLKGAGVSDGLIRIIVRCLNDEPDDRYESCDELRYHLLNYRKTEREYKKNCRRRITEFVSVCFLALLFLLIAFSGYKGIVSDKNNDYEFLLNEGYKYVLENEPEKAMKIYTKAVCEVDSDRPEAYLEMIRVNRDYFDTSEQVLSNIADYIDDEHSSGDGQGYLYMQIGLEYFERLKEYKKSAYYFGLAKEEPLAEIYQKLALYLCESKVDYKELKGVLSDFEDNVNESSDELIKLQNYELICDVLLKCKDELEEAGDRLVEAAEKGLSILEKSEYVGTADQYISFYGYMEKGYEQMGDLYPTGDVEGANACYIKALECCDYLLELVLDEDAITMSNVKVGEYRKNELNDKARLLTKLKKKKKAIAVYENAEREYGEDSMQFFIGHLSLLCDMEEKRTSDVKAWDKERLLEVYNKGCFVSGIENDYRWKRLKVKLMPLFEDDMENGG